MKTKPAINGDDFMVFPRVLRRRDFLVAALASSFVISTGFSHTVQAQDTEAITYLLPAPANAIAFAPFMLAQHNDYYRDAGLEVNFVSVKGGADVGKQLA